MDYNKVYQRPSDGRIEITSILKKYTDYFSEYDPFAYIKPRKRGSMMRIYRSKEDVADYKVVNANIDARVFITPHEAPLKRGKNGKFYPIKVCKKFIHIGSANSDWV